LKQNQEDYNKEVSDSYDIKTQLSIKDKFLKKFRKLAISDYNYLNYYRNEPGLNFKSLRNIEDILNLSKITTDQTLIEKFKSKKIGPCELIETLIPEEEEGDALVSNFRVE